MDPVVFVAEDGLIRHQRERGPWSCEGLMPQHRGMLWCEAGVCRWVEEHPHRSRGKGTGYAFTSERQDSDLKSHLLIMIEDFKKDMNNSLKEIQENTGKHIDTLKEETHKFLK